MLYPTDPHQWSIRKPIMASFLVAFAFLLAIFLFSFNWMNQQQEQDQSDNYQFQVNNLLQKLIEENYLSMEGQLLALIQDTALLEQFQAADRLGLLQKTTKTFLQWQQRQHISHLYFHNPDRTNFLRLHHPKKFGDLIERQTMLTAQTSNTLSHGLETGPLGTVTLRVVMPWQHNGKTIGYLEIGKELHLLFPLIAENFHMQLSMFIYKQFLDNTAWQAHKKLHAQHPHTDWEMFPDLILYKESNRAIPPAIIQRIRSNQWQPGIFNMPVNNAEDIEDLHYFFLPIHNSTNQKIGQLLIIYDDKKLDQNNDKHLYRVVTGITLIALLLGLLFNYLLRRMERNLHIAGNRLQHNESRIRAILDTALDAIISIDTNGHIIEFNKAAERMFGFRKEQLIGHEISETIIPPELRQLHRQGLERYLSTREKRVLGQHIELVAMHADGKRIPIEIAITVIPGTTFTFFTAFLRDISERKQMLLSLNDAIATSETRNQQLRQEVLRHKETLARLQNSEDRFRSVTLSIQDAIIAADHQQIIIFWNHGAETLFGYTRAEILGKRGSRLAPPLLE